MFEGLPASLLVCASVPSLVVLGALAIAGGLHEMIDQIFVFPLTQFGEYRSLPYPSLGLLSLPRMGSWSAFADDLQLAIGVLYFYLFPALCVVGVAANTLVITREKKLTPASCIALYLCMAGLGFWMQASVRSEILHLLPCLLAAILAAFISYGNLGASVTRRRWMRGASILVLIYLLYPASFWFKNLLQGDFERVAPLSESYRMAVDLVRERTGEGDRVFVGVDNHDRIVANYVTLYFLLGRGYGTRYHELHPGVITTEPVQREVVRELERNDVRYILLTSGWWEEPNRSQIDARVDYLDDFIRGNFELIMLLGNVGVWARSERSPSRER